MTGFRLIAPPKDRGPVVTFILSIVAALAAAMILTNFVDALHVSMARGEAMRAAHRVVTAVQFDAGKPILMAMAPAQKGLR